MDLVKIGFLETYTLESNVGIMGGILVTDVDTKPLEFRVTAPIKPTNFQKTLYGEVLLEHISVELIALPLISSVNEQIDLILVRDPFFLGANTKQGIRVVRVFTETEGQNPQNKSEALTTSNKTNQKLLIEIHKKFESELPEIKDKLSSISSIRNIIEPFERLKLACEQVHLQKTGE